MLARALRKKPPPDQMQVRPGGGASPARLSCCQESYRTARAHASKARRGMIPSPHWTTYCRNPTGPPGSPGGHAQFTTTAVDDDVACRLRSSSQAPDIFGGRTAFHTADPPGPTPSNQAATWKEIRAVSLSVNLRSKRPWPIQGGLFSPLCGPAQGPRSPKCSTGTTTAQGSAWSTPWKPQTYRAERDRTHRRSGPTCAISSAMGFSWT